MLLHYKQCLRPLLVIKIALFIESLDASLSSFSSGAARVVEVGCFFAGEPTFFFLSPLLKIINLSFFV